MAALCGQEGAALRSATAPLWRFSRHSCIVACSGGNSSTPPPEEDVKGFELIAKRSSEKQVSLNPVDLGKQSRRAFDDVWRRIKDLGQFTGSSRPDEGDNVLIGGPMCDFATPNADATTVLVAGATSRVGRILIRKLLLRGYKVKALVRTADPETLESLPTSVQIAVGDLGVIETLDEAVEGCNKVICCAAARSSITGDLYRVDNKGVQNLATAFQNYNHRLAQTRAGRSSKSKLVIAKFSKADEAAKWEIIREEAYSASSKMQLGMSTTVDVDENRNALFAGYVTSRGGHVDLVKKLSLPSGSTLDRYEGIVLCVCGDGKIYTLILETSGGEYDAPPTEYYARFLTKVGYSRIRIPFTAFRPLLESYSEKANPFDPFLVTKIGIRFEPRRQRRPEATNGYMDFSESTSFRLRIDYIKALPTGEETDFILVSCSTAGLSSEYRDKVLKAKQGGEGALKASGLGYTIVRPGPLVEEPGGQRALVFDQGNRVTQNISCADVADVCVKALHDPTARNKSFDVCYEYTPEAGQGLYELVAHLPDKSNNYLTPALAVLQKNT